MGGEILDNIKNSRENCHKNEEVYLLCLIKHKYLGVQKISDVSKFEQNIGWNCEGKNAVLSGQISYEGSLFIY